MVRPPLATRRSTDGTTHGRHQQGDIFERYAVLVTGLVILVIMILAGYWFLSK